MAIAKSFIAERMSSGLTSFDMLSGKDILGRISEHCQKCYGSSFNPMAICRAMKESEVDVEIVNVIKAICNVRT